MIIVAYQDVVTSIRKTNHNAVDKMLSIRYIGNIEDRGTLHTPLNAPHTEDKTMTYRELQKALKIARQQELIPRTFKLNQKKYILQAKYDELQSETALTTIEQGHQKVEAIANAVLAKYLPERVTSEVPSTRRRRSRLTESLERSLVQATLLCDEVLSLQAFGVRLLDEHARHNATLYQRYEQALHEYESA